VVEMYAMTRGKGRSGRGRLRREAGRRLGEGGRIPWEEVEVT
jgi:hypothetical protein